MNPGQVFEQKSFFLSVVRYIFWWGMSEAMIRTFFNGKMGQKPEYLLKTSPWLLCGIAYMSGQFFMLKYVVFYGMTRPFGLEDGIDDYPEHPKCIARIYSYSAMWRHFDRGLYWFIRDYIYRPIIREEYRNSLLWKFISSLISFSFVFIYHGTYKVIFIWSIMNLIAVSIESLGKWISKSVKYRQLLDATLSPRGQRRFYCICMTPLLLFSFLSNIYFFIGLKPGHIYISRILSMSIKHQMVLVFVLYSGIQSSVELERKEMFKLT
ncbi:protein-cysteine N-palmitoyltransferase Rasp [Lepeophtheirus salmonis]|uniref:protein-cysteine N-palmitoyltransferase Rasp n=1 Tax=Lepeophtheirus salmonis TaxID=72036 RepID=UPI001AE95793|nr:protein-cysteine N-palmitoyltransferase Rasp-like [Lepeophtheirus salmonis]XP_040571476.1 protein-cysteine N-palmitoyltransferase Rasp-like [Lepeophtheirus salmonis]